MCFCFQGVKLFHNKYAQTFLGLVIFLLTIASAYGGENTSSFSSRTRLLVGVGQANIDLANYDGSVINYLLVRHTLAETDFNLEAGVLNFIQFDHKSANDSYISINSGIVGVTKNFLIDNSYSYDLGFYIMKYESELNFQNIVVGTDTDYSPGIGGRLILNIKNVAFDLGVGWYNDVAGENIKVLSIGIAFKIDKLF